MDTRLRRIRADLYETRTDSPFPGLTTHAYLWTRPGGNALFYCPATDAQFDEMAALGGVADQYLSHQDEAGQMLAALAARFGATLHAPAAEIARIGRHAQVHVPLDSRHVDALGVQVIPTPGHSPGSTSYLVPGADGETYLFTGDTLFPRGDGTWGTFVIPGVGDTDALQTSLRLLEALSPDLVLSSAFAGDSGYESMTGPRWSQCVAAALDELSASASR
ncbi:MBL fold metallo-hydrolase [Mycobacterium sp. NPDC050551]|uniref:MBL fold metallo-hydrolase n=1 Tax=Mycobacterium sp. NPDC050551 TaxID=3155407 RepID=UPI00342BBF56